MEIFLILIVFLIAMFCLALVGSSFSSTTYVINKRPDISTKPKVVPKAPREYLQHLRNAQKTEPVVIEISNKNYKVTKRRI